MENEKSRAETRAAKHPRPQVAFPWLPKRSEDEVGGKGLLTALRLGLHVQLKDTIIVGPKGRESEYRFDHSPLLVLMLTLH